MVDQKEFRIIRNKVLEIRTAFMENIGGNASIPLPVAVQVIDVEEDGHIWMLVNSKLKKWETRCNLPLRLQLFSAETHIALSGVGDVVSPASVEERMREQVGEARNLVCMKIYYAEYLPLGGRLKAGHNLFDKVKDLFGSVLQHIPGRANRRLLIFR